jgi:hypothetical protein
MIPNLKYYGNENEVNDFRLLDHDENSIPLSDIPLSDIPSSEEILLKDFVKVSFPKKYCDCCCHIWQTLIGICKRNLPVFIFTLFSITVVLTLLLMTIAPTCILGPSYIKPISTNKKEIPFDVILYGDSLITGNHYQVIYIYSHVCLYTCICINTFI